MQCNNFAYKYMYLIGVLSHVLSLSSNKGFHSISKAFCMFLCNRMISFFFFFIYWVDIPELIFWFKLGILCKDTDVSIFFCCSILLVLSLSDVSICLYALRQKMQKRWRLSHTHEDPDKAEGRRLSFSFAIREESPGKEISDWTRAYILKATANKITTKIKPKAISTQKQA